ncbi:MAG: response regulator transcription factor [Rhodocyclaceae bacterium]|nr:response regulator transcription factor [Rhodocyclaceae bacterium]
MQISLRTLTAPLFIVAHTNEVLAAGLVQQVMLLSPTSEMLIVRDHNELHPAMARARSPAAITLIDMSFGNANRPSVRYLSLMARNNTYCLVAMTNGFDERLCAHASLVGVHSFLDLDWPAEAIKGALSMIKNGVYISPIMTPGSARFPFDHEDWLLVNGIRQGLTNREIGAQLGLSEGGVKQKLNTLLAKTKCDNRNDLRAFADDYVHFEANTTMDNRHLSALAA